MLKFSYLRKCFKIWGFLKYIETNVKIVHIFKMHETLYIYLSQQAGNYGTGRGILKKSFRIRTVAADAAKQQANQQLPLQGRGSKVSSGRRLPKIEAKSSRVVGYTAAAGWSTISGGQTWFLEQTCVVRPSWGPISTIRTFARQSHHFGLWVRFPLHFPVQLPVQCSAGSRSFWQVMSVSLICVIEYFGYLQYLLPLISPRWQSLFWISIKMWCQATYISKTTLTFDKK